MPPSRQKKAHKAHFSNKKASSKREREKEREREGEIDRDISSTYHSTTYLNIVCIGAQENVIENSGISSYFLLEKIKILTFSGSGHDFF